PSRMSSDLRFLYDDFTHSCHCGLQSTVVDSRVRHLQILDCQRNSFCSLVEYSKKSSFKYLFTITTSSRESPQHILRIIIRFLFIPEQVCSITITGCIITTVECHHPSFRSSLRL